MVRMSCEDHMITVLFYKKYIMKVSYGPLHARGVT